MGGTVFISYSHQDEVWKDRLVRQLRVLELEGDFDLWDDRKIAAGDDWRSDIETAMDRARAAILLISADFLISGFIRGTEIPRRRQVHSESRHQASAANPPTTGAGTMSKTKVSTKLLPFDPARYLTDDAAVAEYMTAILETDDPDLLLLALGDVARARGMAQVAKDAGLGRESLYKALAPGAKPRFDTVLKVARALGIRLAAHVA